MLSCFVWAFLLDRGIAVAKGLHRLRTALPGILATRTDVLAPRLLHLIEDLIGDCASSTSASTAMWCRRLGDAFWMRADVID